MIEEPEIVVKGRISSPSRREAVLDLCIESPGEEKMMLHFFQSARGSTCRECCLQGSCRDHFPPSSA